MIRSYVYFHGPNTAWQGKPHAGEVIAKFESRWKWLAHARALAAVKNLNSGRCGFYMSDSDGNVVKHVEATMKELGAP